MSDGYSAIYEYYDLFTGNVDYGRRADFIDGLFRKYRRPEIVLDAGCGTGTLMSLLAQKGYDMIGIDSSEEMLSVAMEKNPGQLLLCQDLTGCDLYGTVQGIVCMQDTMNHLESKQDVIKAFSRLSLFLEEGCLFIFDLNTEYKHRCVLADNSFVYEDNGAMLVWQNSTSEDLRVSMTLDLFTREHGEIYHRRTGYIDEIWIDEKTLGEALEKAGLELLETYDGDTLESVSGQSERILYVTRKTTNG
ncbi:MAG: class I SAM-dependent methyltransferase [Oscillospiraceae bacterium]|nr:class I SAM-dependent methyltransferase [Oscillospiraceae bacterium]MBQ5341058.1 class I SAM-dependent methyltransferase [Oscillospiraceae bacterium]MBQ5343463.1 class I SAM-dependent methyltransferase [Oscillospiraceae bacterium]